MHNRLFCGDNLRVLREEIASESVDLVYLDPPFNSQEDYGVIYREADGRKAAAQVQVFEDTWHWNDVSALAYYQTVTAGGPVADALQAFQRLLGESGMLAYLSMMAPRLVELHGVLKPTGSLYLHCDPSASHYLKVLLDGVFGSLFRSEIIWKRTSAHSGAKRYGPVHDVILYYTKSERYTWNKIYQDYDPSYVATKFGKVDEATGKPFTDHDLTGPGLRTGDSGLPWRGYDPSTKGRHWQPASYLYTKYRELTGVELNTYPLLDRFDRLNDVGLIYWPEARGKRRPFPRYKQFLDTGGMPLQDIWTDIPPVNAMAGERLRYPTQKPVELLKRIIEVSTNVGDVVLDPFCGCGTTIDAAQSLRRRWIGIDVTHLAISVIRTRLKNQYPDQDLGIRMGWMPTTEDDARKLAAEDPFQFQCWVLGECGINPLYQRRGADRGVDGRMFFFEAGAPSSSPAQIIFSVKSGKLSPVHVRELAGVVKRDRAQIGVLVTLERPTSAMIKEAASATPFRGRNGELYPGLQILTVKDILDGERVAHPAGRSLSFPDAKMARAAASAASAEQEKLKFG